MIGIFTYIQNLSCSWIGKNIYIHNQFTINTYDKSFIVHIILQYMNNLIVCVPYKYNQYSLSLLMFMVQNKQNKSRNIGLACLHEKTIIRSWLKNHFKTVRVTRMDPPRITQTALRRRFWLFLARHCDGKLNHKIARMALFMATKNSINVWDDQSTKTARRLCKQTHTLTKKHSMIKPLSSRHLVTVSMQQQTQQQLEVVICHRQCLHNHREQRNTTQNSAISNFGQTSFI